MVEGGDSRRIERRQSAHINGVIEAGFKALGSDAQRISFCKAMFMAIKIDRRSEGTPCPYDVQQIYEICGFNITVQKKLGIRMGKDDALVFLGDFGVPDLGPASFKKRNTKSRYETFFQRPTPVVNRRNLVMTYAEWLHIEDFLFEPQLPEELMAMLPDGWEPPVGKAE